jgi:hypothetical protein
MLCEVFAIARLEGSHHAPRDGRSKSGALMSRSASTVRSGRIVPLRGTITRSVMTTFKTFKEALVVLHFFELSI